MVKQLALVLALVLTSSCKEHTETWVGIPLDVPRVCSWPSTHGAPGTCIAGGAAYACVVGKDRAFHTTVTCARTSPLWTPESGR